MARSGTVYALDARDGDRIWTGRVGALRLHDAGGRRTGVCSSADSTERSARTAPPTGASSGDATFPAAFGGAAVVVGNLVFFSTLETTTYAARVTDGRIVWKIGLGKYSPGIATHRHYYFSLNGMLVAFRAANSPPEPVLTADGDDGAKAGKRAVPARKRSKP